MKAKSYKFIFLVLFLGSILGTIISLFIGNLIPDGTVKDFFLLTKSLGFGASENNWLELGFMRVKMGLFFEISVVSILGIFISWYLLRYFK